jgi:hypothetical protein
MAILRLTFAVVFLFAGSFAVVAGDQLKGNDTAALGTIVDVLAKDPDMEYLLQVQEHKYTDKKEKKMILIHNEIHMGEVAKSYMRKGFLIYEEMRKYLVIRDT